eukprot:4910128-Amphidinium_carterae.2
MATSSASELTTRPVMQQFTGHVMITNFYANRAQTLDIPTTEASNDTGTRPSQLTNVQLS